jgi:hypothetical protein
VQIQAGIPKIVVGQSPQTIQRLIHADPPILYVGQQLAQPLNVH